MSTAAVSANRLELLQIAEAVAREKLIDRELVLEAMEDSLGKAARARYGLDVDVRAHIDRKSGEITMTRVKEVVEEVENYQGQMSIEEARVLNPEVEIGDFVEIDTLPTMEFGRVAAQTAKQVIVRRRCATPSGSGSTRNTRTASAPSSTAWSSASNTAT